MQTELLDLKTDAPNQRDAEPRVSRPFFSRQFLPLAWLQLRYHRGRLMAALIVLSSPMS